MEAVAASGTYCSATRADGERCRSQILTENGVCWVHDETKAEEATKARRRGGHASSAISRTRRLAPKALIGVYEALEAALGEVHNGELSPARASAMASVARAMAHILSVGELEQRLRAIEEGMLHDFA